MALKAPQPFTQYNVKVFRSITAYLQNTNANSAFNKRFIRFTEHVSHSVSGFIGVESDTSTTLIVAFTWGSTATHNRHSFVLEIDPTRKGMGISVIEKPNGFSAKKVADYAKSFIAHIYSDVHDKMVERSVFPTRRKNGGVYKGIRLEAHKRNNKLPANKFTTYAALFSTDFAINAAKAHVTLK